MRDFSILELPSCFRNPGEESRTKQPSERTDGCYLMTVVLSSRHPEQLASPLAALLTDGTRGGCRTQESSSTSSGNDCWTSPSRRMPARMQRTVRLRVLHVMRF